MDEMLQIPLGGSRLLPSDKAEPRTPSDASQMLLSRAPRNARALAEVAELLWAHNRSQETRL